MNRPRGTPVPLLVVLLLAACGSDPATPRGTAELFLDAHYVHIDLPAARTLASGVAQQKIEREMELVAGQVIDASTRKPRVHYRLLEEHPDGEDTVRFVYLGTITVEDADQFERRWLLTVRRQAEGWRVTNYEELEG